MRKPIAIALFCLAITAMPACSTQKRAQRHLQRAVELCPELVQKKSYIIDTTLPVPGYTDRAIIPFGVLMEADTVFCGTDHGFFTIAYNDSALIVDYTADTSTIQYQDTIHHAQVVATQDPPQKTGRFLGSFVAWILGIGFGGTLTLYLLRNAINNPN